MPYRVLGPAADQTARERLFQVRIASQGVQASCMRRTLLSQQDCLLSCTPQVGGLSITILQHPHVGLKPLESRGRPCGLAGVEMEQNAQPAGKQSPPTALAATAQASKAAEVEAGAGVPRAGVAAAVQLGPAGAVVEQLAGAKQPGGDHPFMPSDQRSAGGHAQPSRGTTGPAPDQHLGNVGFVAWQCGFMLADLLLRRPPLGHWAGVRALDLVSNHPPQ